MLTMITTTMSTMSHLTTKKELAVLAHPCKSQSGVLHVLTIPEIIPNIIMFWQYLRPQSLSFDIIIMMMMVMLMVMMVISEIQRALCYKSSSWLIIIPSINRFYPILFQWYCLHHHSPFIIHHSPFPSSSSWTVQGKELCSIAYSSAPPLGHLFGYLLISVGPLRLCRAIPLHNCGAIYLFGDHYNFLIYF